MLSDLQNIISEIEESLRQRQISENELSFKILMDWYEENGIAHNRAPLEWLLNTNRRPYWAAISEDWSWFGIVSSGDMKPPHCKFHIPNQVFGRLHQCNSYKQLCTNYIEYFSLKDALEAFCFAFNKAVLKGWNQSIEWDGKILYLPKEYCLED